MQCGIIEARHSADADGYLRRPEFWPALGQISAPLRSVPSKQRNTRVLLGSVEDIAPNTKEVFLADGAVLAYDSVIIATGAQTSYFGNHEWQEWAPGLKTLLDSSAQFGWHDAS
jgi:NADH dehydrogenase FAD-containing subunit